MRDFLKQVEATLSKREKVYPPYRDEAQKISEIWNILYPNRPMEPQLVPRFMVVLKLVRDSGSDSHDHLIDVVGYIAKADEMRHGR